MVADARTRDAEPAGGGATVRGSDVWLQHGQQGKAGRVHSRPRQSRETVEGAFEVTKRVAWALRGEGAGLLIKNGGENIVGWQGYSFAAARICYPDGHIYKVLTDVPSTQRPVLAGQRLRRPELVRAGDRPESVKGSRVLGF